MTGCDTFKVAYRTSFVKQITIRLGLHTQEHFDCGDVFSMTLALMFIIMYKRLSSCCGYLPHLD